MQYCSVWKIYFEMSQCQRKKLTSHSFLWYVLPEILTNIFGAFINAHPVCGGDRAKLLSLQLELCWVGLWQYCHSPTQHVNNWWHFRRSLYIFFFRPAISVQCSSDPKLANRMFLRISRWKKIVFWTHCEEQVEKRGLKRQLLVCLMRT